MPARLTIGRAPPRGRGCVGNAPPAAAPSSCLDVHDVKQPGPQNLFVAGRACPIARSTPRTSHGARDRPRVPVARAHAASVARATSVRMFSQVAWAISPSRLLAEGFLALPPVSPVGTPVGVRVWLGGPA